MTSPFIPSGLNASSPGEIFPPASALDRRPWTTPVVSGADPRKTGAHVGVGSDGTDTTGYKYGS